MDFLALSVAYINSSICLLATTFFPNVFSNMKMDLIVPMLQSRIQSGLFALYNCTGDIVFSIVVGMKAYAFSFSRTAN